MGQPSPLATLMLGVAVLAVGALTSGGYVAIARRGERQKGVLMLICAAVILGNVLIWTV